MLNDDLLMIFAYVNLNILFVLRNYMKFNPAVFCPSFARTIISNRLLFAKPLGDKIFRVNLEFGY